MRYLNYILFGLGGLLAVVALAFFLLDTAEPEAVPPQTDDALSVSATVSDPASNMNNNSDNTKIMADEVVSSDQAGAVLDDNDARNAGNAEEYVLTIDIAQVKPDGSAVFAGQGAPGARITVFEGDVLLGRTVADDNGEWVVILEKPLAPGQHLVSVAMETADGKTQLADLTLAIEISASGTELPLVALLPLQSDEMPQLLQSPDDVMVDEAFSDPLQQDLMSVASVAPRALFWREGNVLGISGVSRGGVKVNGQIGNTVFAESLVLADGQWQLLGNVDPEAASFVIDFTLFDDGGQQVATYQLPVRTRDLDAGLDGSEMVVVQRGDALWRIAYRRYGEGVRYVDIVRRNAASINDPDLIYPNQIFAIPK